MLLFLQDLLESDMVFWVIIGIIAVFAIAAATFSNVLNTRARERSRREIAAYIAEGAMTPEQGEKLMRATPDDDDV